MNVIRQMPVSLEAQFTDIIARLRQGRFPNEQAISQTECCTSSSMRCHGSRFRGSRGLRVLQELGWDTWDTAVVWPEYQTGQGRADCRKQQRRLADSASPSAGNGCHPERSERISVVSDSSFIPHPSAFSSDRRVYKLDLFERPPAEAAETLTRYLARARVESGEALETDKRGHKSNGRRIEALALR